MTADEADKEQSAPAHKKLGESSAPPAADRSSDAASTEPSVPSTVAVTSIFDGRDVRERRALLTQHIKSLN
ncbi:hypothetical protein ABTM89_20065, partial [Acinetobacter baumannii]